MKLFIVLVALVAFAVGAAPPVCTDCPTCGPVANPDFPRVGDTSCTAKVVFILDESGSLRDFRSEVVRAATAFWTALSELNGLGGSAKLGVVEFSNAARVVQPVLRSLDAAYLAELSTYINSEVNDVAGYSPQGTTNWGAAFKAVSDTFTSPDNTPEIVVFFTDGEPNLHDPFICDGACYPFDNLNGDLGNSCFEADRIKARGIKLFTVAVGDSAGNIPAIQIVSGGSTTSTPFGAGATEWNLMPDTFRQADYVVDPDLNNLNSVLRAVAAALCPRCSECAIFPNNPNPASQECTGPNAPTLPNFSITTDGSCGAPRFGQSVEGFTGSCRAGSITKTVAVLDECDQESDRTASFVTRIVDTTPPALVCPPSGERGTCPEALSAISALQTTATDLCSAVTVTKSEVRSLLAGVNGDVVVGYEVTFTAEDGCENVNRQPCVVQYSCAQGADLEVTKGSNIEDCAVAGDSEGEVRYTVIVKNLGPALARDVVLQDIFPLGGPLERRGAITATVGEVEDTPGGLIWRLGDLAVGGRETISFRFFLGASYQVGLVTNVANASSPTPDPNLCNNVDKDVVRVCRESDLSVTKTDNVLQVTAGQMVGNALKQYVYEIRVTNNGVSDAANVRLADDWPRGFTRVQYQVSADGSCVDTADGFRCQWPNIPAGESRVVLATYTVPSTTLAGAQVNSVHVSSDSRDTNGENNHAHDVTFVRTEADLAIYKDDGVTNVTAGDGRTYTYTIRVVNNGPSVAREVRITDNWPAGITRLSDALTPSQGSCVSTLGGSFSCNLGELAVNAQATLQVSYSVPSSTETCDLANVASVSAVTFDPNLCNNDAKDVNNLLEHARLEVWKRAVDANGNEIEEIPLGDTRVYYYEITVSNLGPSTARHTTITDTWPSRLTQFKETLTCTQGGCATTGGDFTCALGSIRANTRVDCRVKFTLSEQQRTAGALRNAVSAFSPTDGECRSAFHQITAFDGGEFRKRAVGEENGAGPEHIVVKPLVERLDSNAELTVALFNPHSHSVTLQRLVVNYLGARNDQRHAVVSDSVLPSKVTSNSCAQLKGTVLQADTTVTCKVVADASILDALKLGSVTVTGTSQCSKGVRPLMTTEAIHEAPKAKENRK